MDQDDSHAEPGGESHPDSVCPVCGEKVTIGVEPLATLTTFADGRIATRIQAGHSFAGRKVQLQELGQGQAGWRTIQQMPLNANSRVVFPALSTSGDVTLRIALSVNQAGVGFLGSTSHPFTYHGG